MTDRRVLLVAHTGRPEVASTAAGGLQAAGRRRDRTASRWPARAVSSTWRCSTRTTIPTHHRDRARPRRRRHAAARRGTRPAAAAPVLGINLGRVGFLAEADVDQLDETLDAIIDHRYRISSRMTVEVTVEHEGVLIATGWALNEISVEKGTRERILDVSSRWTGTACRPTAVTAC